ncbi:MAG: helix-turn-helix transcriptional regulator [Coriobacteriia bacterium]|nr:helix-turn-helix transcriptional regulator [Coriobacteriia bacterium]
MDGRKFGDILAERRRRLGLTIDQAVSATKLRPQVLESFERSDFKNMPPKGYAQGMLSSYARFLRLDPREVLDPYFDQLYIYERERDLAYRSQRNNRYESPEQISRRRTGVGNTQAGRMPSSGYANNQDDTHVVYTPSAKLSPSFSSDRSVGNVYSRYHNKNQYYEDDSYRHDEYDYEDERESYEPAYRTRRPQRSARTNLEPYENFSDYDRPARNRSSRRSQAGGSSQGLNAIFDAIPLPRNITMIIVVALLVIILLVIFGSIINSCSRNKDANDTNAQIITPEVVTQTAPSVQQPTSATSAIPSESAQAPQEKIVSFTIPEGKESYVEVLLDGTNVYMETAKGPVTETYTVKESITITASQPKNIEVKDDGTVVAMTTTSGIGSVTISALPEEPENTEDNPDGEKQDKENDKQEATNN